MVDKQAFYYINSSAYRRVFKVQICFFRDKPVLTNSGRLRVFHEEEKRYFTRSYREIYKKYCKHKGFRDPLTKEEMYETSN